MLIKITDSLYVKEDEIQMIGVRRMFGPNNKHEVYIVIQNKEISINIYEEYTRALDNLKEITKVIDQREQKAYDMKQLVQEVNKYNNIKDTPMISCIPYSCNGYIKGNDYTHESCRDSEQCTNSDCYLSLLYKMKNKL